MVTSEYWQKYWDAQAEKSIGENKQSRVLRTLNREPIDSDLWISTLRFVVDRLDLRPVDVVLDLCSGNGVFTLPISEQVKHVTAVDLSSGLLEEISRAEKDNIEVIKQNVLNLELPKDSVDKILLYAGIQYFTQRETILLFERMKDWLKPGGLVYIGDIPDSNKLWNFFNTCDRERAYFESLKEFEPIVGEWYARDFLQKLARFAGFSQAEVIEQPSDMIYSFFRYDLELVP